MTGRLPPSCIWTWHWLQVSLSSEAVSIPLSRLKEVQLANSKGEGVDEAAGEESYYFHIIGDSHQPNSRGLYTHYKDSY